MATWLAGPLNIERRMENGLQWSFSTSEVKQSYMPWLAPWPVPMNTPMRSRSQSFSTRPLSAIKSSETSLGHHRQGIQLQLLQAAEAGAEIVRHARSGAQLAARRLPRHGSPAGR